MCRINSPNEKAQDVKFFKIDQGTYNTKTGVWGSNQMMKQNMTWKTTIPRDIAPSRYIIRHELIALQLGGSGNSNGAGTSSSGAQLYRVCINVNIKSTGTANPLGVKFPRLTLRRTLVFLSTSITDQNPSLIVDGVNKVLSKGGGYHYDVGEGALNTPVNGGDLVAPIGSLLRVR